MIADPTPVPASETRGGTRPIPPRPRTTFADFGIALLIGVAAAALGLLPWLVTGLRLPLQNLWAVNTMPDAMPIALLPFSQYALTLIVAVIVTGSVVAGIVGRVRRRLPMVALALGVALVQVVALVQTAVTVSNGLSDGVPSSVYLVALTSGTTAVIVVGLAILAVVARASVAVATVALVASAVALGFWVDALIAPQPGLAGELQYTLLGLSMWVPGIAAGLALAWCGLHSTGRIVAWVLSLLLLWVLPPLFTAVSAAAGTRVLASRPLDMLDYGAQVFQSAIGGASGQWRLLVVAIVIGLVGVAIRIIVARWKPTAPRPEGDVRPG